jgi:hypothetical protein
VGKWEYARFGRKNGQADRLGLLGAGGANGLRPSPAIITGSCACLFRRVQTDRHGDEW